MAMSASPRARSTARLSALSSIESSGCRASSGAMSRVRVVIMPDAHETETAPSTSSLAERMVRVASAMARSAASAASRALRPSLVRQKSRPPRTTRQAPRASSSAASRRLTVE
jgi:hypothetical protein